MAATARRHETRALLRAHLSAASGYPHLTRHCPICHRLQKLAMERCTETDWDTEAECQADETPGANSGSL
ncbi:hypothetical protein GCM10023084_63610 [Streptomyces lacrimifluminis]|uniref:Uncharacterized protein n=1 Tax=Streptomyces lacrimifluminis TaxID=1500077 RepID=A0A917P2R0_9ACTN|nr:DUF6274 family protein [Streptomyces lacrimifluminis]GGJ57374.1 hypothetical protein GCM10012282_63260 [Streptomyces lacrimifluminis]